jgi:hypothetical protein
MIPNDNFSARSASRFFVGHWNELTDEQHRLFITYVVHNYSGDIGGGDPAEFAERLWNDSADAANDGTVGDNDRLLELSQLTTFIGVTSLWQRRQVSNQVERVTHVNGDQPDDNFRLFGSLLAGGGQIIKQVFDHGIGGSGHGEYSVSRREQGVWGQPNGQFSMTPDLLRFDSDVDYRCLLSAGHNTKENSDIMAFDGGTPHLRRHIERYGPVPIRMESIDGIVRKNERSVLAYERADELFAEFRSRFESELTLASVVNDLFSREAPGIIKNSGFFESWGLDPKLVHELDDAQVMAIFVQLMDFYYLHALSEMNFKDVSSGETIQAVTTERSMVRAEINSSKFLRTLTNPEATDDASVQINNKEDLETLLRETASVSDALRRNLLATGLHSELYRQNVERLETQLTDSFRMDTTRGPDSPTLVLERGIYVLFMVEEEGRLRISNLGIGS